MTPEHSLYFRETGHTLKAPFLAFYLAHRNPALLGYPITEAFEHEGWLVQYFQNVRLEYHPENEPAYQVTVGWLGQHLHRKQPPAFAVNDALYFAETGHNVSGAFRTFFSENGGTVQFGRPLSEPFIHQGRLMQDFQSARFIWHPALPGRTWVHLEPLGETYFLASGLPLALLDIVPPSPQATQYEPVTAELPPNATVTLQYEATPHHQVIRVLVTAFNDQIPVVGYRPTLAWLNQQRQLPPTNSAGLTQTLVQVQDLDRIDFILREPGRPTRLLRFRKS